MGRRWPDNSMLHRTLFTTKQPYMTIKLYEWDLTSVGRIQAQIQRGGGGQGLRTSPLKIIRNIGFLSNTGQDPLKNYKATKPAMLGHHWQASETPFMFC